MACKLVVFIKDERDKTKARDRYIIVEIDKEHASLQKLTDKFMSRKYTIPLTRLYPAATPTGRLPPSKTAEEDSDKDNEFYLHNSINDDTDDIDNIGSDSESEEEVIPPAPPAPPPPPLRPPRVRQQPAWMRSGEYEMNSE